MNDRLASADAVVVGAGPNGLAAAVALARAGKRVTVLERGERIGGACASASYLDDDCVMDLCSAVHPLAVASPFFRELDLEAFGLRWIEPPVAVAHPFDDGSAVALYRDLGETAAGLGRGGSAYHRLLAPFVAEWPGFFSRVLKPFPHELHFGLHGLRSARALCERLFDGNPRGKALFAGLAAHSTLRLDQPLSGGIALILAVAAHACNWPFPEGGAGQITQALARILEAGGGEIILRHEVRSVSDLPRSQLALFDITPKQLLSISDRSPGVRLSAGYRKSLTRYRYGPGVFKLDWVLSAPIPWKAVLCRQAGTVHLGGSFEEIAASEQSAWSAAPSRRPFVLLGQPSLFDPTRTRGSKHTAWAYCHVPAGCEDDLTQAIESQVERFAPGFRETVLARKAWRPAELEAKNPNLVSGDISGGATSLIQFFFRPVFRVDPYRIPQQGDARTWFLCSASTPPGPAVHGMCGYYAARSALRSL